MTNQTLAADSAPVDAAPAETGFQTGQVATIAALLALLSIPAAFLLPRRGASARFWPTPSAKGEPL